MGKTPGDVLSNIKRLIVELNIAEPKTVEYEAALVLLCAYSIGPLCANDEEIADFAGLGVGSIRQFLRNLRDGGVIVGETFHAEWADELDENKTENLTIGISLDVAVALGQLHRRNAEDGRAMYAMTEEGMRDVEMNLLTNPEARVLLDRLIAQDIPDARRQDWLCESCGAFSSHHFKKGADFFSVLNAIKTAHHKRSPNCPTAIDRVRLRNAEMVSEDEWVRLIKRNEVA